MPRPVASTLLLVSAAALCFAESDKPLLLQKPTLNRTHIVFAYSDDLWSVSRHGGEASSVNAGSGAETDLILSPDGTQMLFIGEYDGNVDVFVIPSEGGIPKRLTYHPAQDRAAGWSPDGKRILFRSTRDSYSRFRRLYTLPADGSGLPEPVPLPMAEEGSYSADGSRLAYVPLPRAFLTWKHYRGGQTAPVWIANLADSSIEKLPRTNSNDFNPMWVGDRIYFLSDRNGPVTLFAYDVGSKKVSEVFHNTGLDIKSASAGPGAIIYEQFGDIHLYDLKTGKTKKVEIHLAGDLPEVRAHYEKVANNINKAAISPTGARAV